MEPLTVAAVQTIARPGELDGSVEDHARLALAAARAGARLSVFPELSLTGYDRRLTRADALVPTDSRLAPLQGVADAHDMIIVAGAPVAVEDGLLIAAFCFIPGSAALTYSKRFLHEGEEIAFSPGAGGPALSLGGRVICNAICAEITHPEHALDAAEQGANIYAASCFITPQGYEKDAGLLRGYALVHHMAVVMSNFGSASGGWNSAGRSAIWSRSGELLALGPPDGEGLVVARLD